MQTVNDFWNDKADIHFLPVVTPAPAYDNHVIIPDPVAGPSWLPKAKPGDIEIDPRFFSEMKDAFLSGKAAWEQLGQSHGIVIIVAHDLVSVLLAADVGANPGHDKTVSRNGGQDFGVFPRKLITEDVIGQYALVPEPARFVIKPGGPDRNGYLEDVLAHELGHCLLLCHGDGIDNEPSGTQPPDPGPRKFDVDTDPQEFQNYDEAPSTTTRSLMSPNASMLQGLTPLQRELAREAAVIVPGSITGIPWLLP
jgi:hypothetical protein